MLMVKMSGRGSTRVVRFQKVVQGAAKRRKAPLAGASPRTRRNQSLEYDDSDRETDDESVNNGSSRSHDAEDDVDEEEEEEEENDLESSDSASSDSEEDEEEDSSDEEHAGRKRPRTAAQRAALSSSIRRPGSARLREGVAAGASEGKGQGKGGSGTADARAARLALRHAKSPSILDRRRDVIVLEDGQGSGLEGGKQEDEEQEEEEEGAQQQSSRKAAQHVKGAALQVSSSQPASAVDSPLLCEWLGAPTRVELGVRTHYAAFRLRQVAFAAGDWVEVLAERPDATGKVHRRLYAARLLDSWCYPGRDDALHAEALVQWAYHADECGGAGGMTAQESAGPREVYPTILCEPVPLASINGRAVLLPPLAWQDRRQRKAKERLVQVAKARVSQSASLAGAAKNGGALVGDGDSDSDDSDCSVESALRVQRLPVGESRVVAVYSARYSYDKPTRRFLPYTADPATDRARSHAILAAVGISPALGLVPPPTSAHGGSHGARKGAGAGGDKKVQLPPLQLAAATTTQTAVVPASLLAHVRVPIAGEGVASGAGVLVGAGSTDRSILHGGAGVGQAVGAGAALTASPPQVHGNSPSDLYTATVRSLHLSSVPPTLPCRDTERAQIRTLLTAGIKQAWSGGGGTALYISGMPGTGKTASVTEVVRSCTSQAAVGALPAFRYMEVNAMKLATPYALYSAVYRALTGVQVPPARACALLEARLTGGKSGDASGSASSSQAQWGEGGKKRGVGRPRKASKVEIVTPPPARAEGASGSPGASAAEGGGAARPHEVLVLVVDELDYLVTRKQSVLYNLFEWPMRAGSGLVVIGIANTMDMPERLLPRVASRLGLGRVVFTPYTPDQIQTIVQARLAALPPGVLDSMACTLASKKVASVSGDIRRALAMLSHAAKYALERCTHAAAALPATPFTITLEDVKKASSSLAVDAHSARLAATTAHERLLLLSLAAHVQANGGEGAMLDVLYTRAQGMLQAHVAERDVAAAMRVAPSPATLDFVRSALPSDVTAMLKPSTLAWAARWEEVHGLHEGAGGATAAATGGTVATGAVQGAASAAAATSPGPSEGSALQLAARYLPVPPVSALETAAHRLAESHILDVQALTVTGAASALAAGTLTGRITEGARLAGVYPAIRLCVGVDEVVAGLRGDPLLAKMQAAGALM